MRPGPPAARFAGWRVLAAGVLVVLGAAALIGHLRRSAERSRECQRLLALVDAAASRLSAAEWKAMASSSAGPEISISAAEARGDLEHDLGELTALGSPAELLGPVREACRIYVAAIDAELRLFRERRVEEARAADATFVDPAYRDLARQIRRATAAHSAQADWDTRLADVGASSIMSLAVLTIFLLARRFDRVRRAAHRAEAEQAARLTSERRFQALVQNSSDTILAVDAGGRVRYATSSASRVLDAEADELIDQSLLGRVTPEDAGPVRDFLARCAAGTPGTCEFRWRRRDGSLVWIEALGNSQLDNPDIRALVLACRDVSERKEAVIHLQRTAALSAVGQLATGVAHNFNNVLSVVLGRTQLLERRVQDEEVRRGLAVIARAALDGAATAQRLQSFASRRRDEAAVPLLVDDLLRDVAEFTRARWHDDSLAHGIQYEVALDLASEATVRGSPAELREVFTGLVINALDAMPAGGTLTIRSASAGDEVHLAVSDTGAGMSEEVQRRLFEPFFTTKGPQRAGLSLAASHGVVERHGGRIEVASEPGRGTTLTVVLPLYHGSAPRPGAAPERPVRALVVDDEAAVRDSVTELLRQTGHEVLAATGGTEALQLLEVLRFDLVLADVDLPGMNGRALAARIRERWPRTTVVLMSPNGVAAPGERPLVKPVTREGLAGVLDPDPLPPKGGEH